MPVEIGDIYWNGYFKTIWIVNEDNIKTIAKDNMGDFYKAKKFQIKNHIKKLEGIVKEHTEEIEQLKKHLKK